MLADTIIEAIGAAASLAAVVYARKTVCESIESRKDGEGAHREQMVELANARQAAFQQNASQLLSMCNAQTTASARHHAEMADRRRLAETEAESRQIMQLERVSELVLEIVDVARAEYRNRPEELAPGHTGSRLPALLRRLQNALAAHISLGGVSPTITSEMATRGYGAGANAISLVREGINALDEIRDTTINAATFHDAGSGTATRAGLAFRRS